MKKILYLLTIAILLVGCSKDDDATPTATLDVKKLTTFIDKSPEYVKSSFNDGKLQKEESTLGKATLRYRLHTSECDFNVTFNGNTEGSIMSIIVYGKVDGGYSNGVETYKKIMDRINGSISFVTYIARYADPMIDFTDRIEFWQYVSERDVNKTIREIWWLENSDTVYFTVDGFYSRSDNAIEIEIKKTVRK